MLDAGLWRVFKAAAKEYDWCVLVNKTDVRFYTSDNTVVIVPKGKRHGAQRAH
jgi:hypothetical protein